MVIQAMHAMGAAEAAKPVSRIAVTTGWEFRQHLDPNSTAANGAPSLPEGAGFAVWRPAEVPGMVGTDLLRNRLIPDPFYRENEASLQWMENADWEYRATLQAGSEMLSRRHIELVFDGLDGYAEVFVNRHKLITADNAFRQWRAEARPWLKSGANELLVVFPSPIRQARIVAAGDPSHPQGGAEDKTYIRKPAYEYGWDWGPRFVNSGIWRAVRLELWDDLRISDFHISQPDVSAAVAHLVAEIEIEAASGQAARIALESEHGSRKPEQALSVSLHPGVNTLRLPFAVAAPDLWYPAGYGAQAMYTFRLVVNQNNQTEDEALRRTGLRSVVLRREADTWGRSFEFVMNGIPMFAKGADVIPFDSFPARVTEADYRRVLQSARDANMNMIRHWGG
ncbi:MAG: glycoside hydrolase family 2 protein, partial [Acidobacteria bacterium]|nr:glycoside hydrolase family 2 protein [Acidobacteriota bacterium]